MWWLRSLVALLARLAPLLARGVAGGHRWWCPPTAAGHHHASLRDEARALRDRKRKNAALFGAGVFDESEVLEANMAIKERLAEVEQLLTAAGRTDTVSGLVVAPDVRAAWNRLDILTQRTVLDGLIERIVIEPTGRGVRTWHPDSVRVVWRDEIGSDSATV